jgi:hypothetical protein
MRDIIVGILRETQAFYATRSIYGDKEIKTQQGRPKPPLPVRIITGFLITGDSGSS